MVQPHRFFFIKLRKWCFSSLVVKEFFRLGEFKHSTLVYKKYTRGLGAVTPFSIIFSKKRKNRSPFVRTKMQHVLSLDFLKINFNLIWSFFTLISGWFTPINFVNKWNNFDFYLPLWENFSDCFFFFKQLYSSIRNTKIEAWHPHFQRVISPLKCSPQHIKKHVSLNFCYYSLLARITCK